MHRPVSSVMPSARAKLLPASLSSYSDSSRGGTWVRLNSISRTPRIRAMAAKCTVWLRPSEETEPNLEQAFHGGNVLLVDHKQKDMVTTEDFRVFFHHDHLFITNDGANGSAGRQADIPDPATNHLAGLLVAMGNGLDGFGRTAPQRMHADHIALAYMGQQYAECCQLRTDGDVDGTALHQIDIGRIVDDGHHLAHSDALGQQAGHDVGVIIVGDCNEQVGLVDVFFQQQIAVGGAAVQHHAAVQMVRQMAAAGRVELDDFDLAAAFQG